MYRISHFLSLTLLKELHSLPPTSLLINSIRFPHSISRFVSQLVSCFNLPQLVISTLFSIIVNEVTMLDTILGQIYQYLSDLAVKWSRNQNPIPEHKNFLLALTRATERTSNLQGNLGRLTRLIRLNFPAH
ncbi:hypothetical protein D915_009934 [Fasciola hepatica]|uniref:Uncharacterized protein n=1 Tax=Fasciola hepatica TaxID=6192 RepID=A0A4E0R0J5_FASHE|nr:hypothetical protein D915_009934 [Fasciola hepatica]